MNRFRNCLLVVLSVICIACLCIVLTACYPAEDTRDKDIVAIYNMYVAHAEENGTTPLSYSQWLLTIKGEKGDAGKDGTNGQDGKSAYQIWLDNGNTGSEVDFLNWLKGSDGTNGTNGKDGTNGTNGQDGKSAYQIWLDNGHTGSEVDFLNLLKGSNGTNGANGKDGLGIKNVAINNDGDLIITFDDNTTMNAGHVVDKGNRLNEDNKITFKTLTVTENTAYGKVSNATETFSFIEEIDLVGNAGYTVYTDLQGTKSVPTKNVELAVGDNTFYILETCANDSNLYTVTIRRRPMYTVTFMDLENASLPMIQQVEEDSFAVRPDIDNDLCGWDPDSAFTTPITKNITIEVTKKLIFDEQTLFLDNKLGLTEFGAKVSYINITEEIIIHTNHSITSGAFFECSNLKNVTLCKELETIKEKAFMCCTNLQSITLPTNLKSIEKSVFESCSSLTTVKIPGSVKTIGQWAFRNCDSLTSVTMEDGVEQLGEEVFYDCGKLQSVTIPASVTQMGNFLFKDCTELSTITYLGTMAQWNSLVENVTLYNGSKTITVNCSDGTVQLQGAQA